MYFVRWMAGPLVNPPHGVCGWRLGQAIDNAGFWIGPSILENDILFTLYGEVGVVGRFQILAAKSSHVAMDIHEFRHDSSPSCDIAWLVG
jgi:hypothetical protein